MAEEVSEHNKHVYLYEQRPVSLPFKKSCLDTTSLTDFVCNGERWQNLIILEDIVWEWLTGAEREREETVIVTV